MSNSAKYNFPKADTVTIVETNQGVVIGKKYVKNVNSDPQLNAAINTISELLQNLAKQHPEPVTQTEAENIITVAFTELQTQNPQRWQTISQNLLDPERWLQGGKAALVATADHYLNDHVIGKAGIAFLDEFSKTP